MSRYLRPLTEPFSNKYRQYLPLATSTPRGSVSGQGNLSDSPPISPTSAGPFRGLSNKAGVRRRSLSWHVRLLVLLLAFAYAAHTAIQHFFRTSPEASEEARIKALNLLNQQLTTSSYPQTTFSSNAPQNVATSVHRLFSDKSPGVASRDVLPIRAYDALTDECIEEWVVHHRWGAACRGTDLSHGLKIDAVWAWVNGSDPAQVLARNAYKPSSPINVDAAHRYADHNELLYSMRSAYKSFGANAIGKMHVMASAYPLPQDAVDQLALREKDTRTMVGQVPYWLHTSASLGSEDVKIQVHHDAAYFRPMQRLSDDLLTPKDVDAWRSETLPSFNSLAVESQLFNLPDASSDQLVYLNDDFFTMVSNEVSDLTSPLFGTVVKSDTRLFSFYRPSEHPFQRLWNPAGEEVGIKRAAWILGQRFSMRTLPYITHHPRSLSLPLLKEAAQTFPDAFSNTTLARFRAQKEVPDSIQAFFLASWYMVERHREALLWTWVVAKWGGDAGIVSSDTKRAMWNELSKVSGGDAGDKIDVRRPIRQSRDADSDAFEQAGVPAPKNTQYSFSSQDGYALSYLDWTWPWERTRNGYPDLSGGESGSSRAHPRSWFASAEKEATSRKVCHISLSQCLSPSIENETADGLFKRVAFEQPQCGDCLLAALLNASGRKGISAFLPPATATIRINPTFSDMNSKAHLPLTSHWQSTDFSLSSIFPLDPSGQSLSLRIWCTRLIQRYSYVLGSTPSTFYKVEYASRLPHQLQAVDDTLTTATPTTYVCLNDDIKESESGTKKLNSIMHDWFASHWSEKIPGEIDV